MCVTKSLKHIYVGQFQRLLDNDEKLLARQERSTLSLERISLQMSEITSNLETLNQRRIFSHMSNDNSMENEVSREELIIDGEEFRNGL